MKVSNFQKDWISFDSVFGCMRLNSSTVIPQNFETAVDVVLKTGTSEYLHFSWDDNPY